MSWTTALEDIRRLLSDGSTDKLRHRKRVFGTIDGTNLVFKTLEFRRVTDFTTAASPEGVYVDGSAVAVALDNPEVGEFTLSTAPLDGSVVEATYYSQWFTDQELDGFLQDAAYWLNLGTAINIPPGLRPAALHYAAQEAYLKLALRWTERLSETYRLEDAPGDDTFAVVDKYRAIAMDMHKKSMQLRDDYYSRSGQNKAPSFQSIAGRVVDPVPKR